MRGVVMYTAGDVRVEEREDPKIIQGISDDLHIHPVFLVLAGVCAVRRSLFEWR
ncbi:hypothetical protein ACIBJF_51960 [Streptomyces sp. NPDC050743]|uniref:hypothetical protein n=1 Tax=Streptomyces sp. NPDC050743 TaxID=3365634 RepID=UPI0037AF3154